MTNHERCLRFIQKIAKMKPAAIKHKLRGLAKLCDEAIAILTDKAWDDTGIALNSPVGIIHAHVVDARRKRGVL